MNFGAIDNYILFGGGQLLAYIAEVLVQQGITVRVVTSPRHSTESLKHNEGTVPFVDYLKNEQVDFIISNDIAADNDVISSINESTLGLSFGAAWIFKKSFIDLFNGRLLNLHAARLPQDRGCGGFSWRILRSERIGVSLIHQIDVGVDTGDIVLSEEYIYPAHCKLPSEYIEYTINKYKELFGVFFEGIQKRNTFNLTSQQEYFSSYWPRLVTDVHGYIDWNWKLTDIEKFICAFDDPYDGASTFIGGNKVRIKKASFWNGDGTFHPFQKGIIYRISAESIFVSTENGSLLIKSVLDEEGNDVKNILSVGERFFTPRSYLEDAMQYRAIFTPEGLKN